MTIQPSVSLLEVTSDVVILLLDGSHQPIVLFAHQEHLALEGRSQDIGNQAGRPVVLHLFLDKTTDVSLSLLHFMTKALVLEVNQCYPLNGICTGRLTAFCSFLSRNQRR
jgi:hypothetical protein